MRDGNGNSTDLPTFQSVQEEASFMTEYSNYSKPFMVLTVLKLSGIGIVLNIKVAVLLMFMDVSD